MSTLKLEKVSRWYGNVVAVNDVSFEVGAGITGLLGPNGAGKTTLLHMMAGFLAPSAGRVQLDETPTWRHAEVYRAIGFVPEREAVYPFLTARQFVTASARLQDMENAGAAASRAIEMVELGEAADRAIGGYSKGMRQRAKVAAALVHDPKVLILDEPFNGMDPRQRLHMMDLLRGMAADGRTILFSSHILEEVERLSDRVLVIVAGRLAASGDFRKIRRLMTDRPHRFTLRSSDNRRLARELMAGSEVDAVELRDGVLTVHTGAYGALTRAVAPAAQRANVSILEMRPADESLESVFSYLVHR
ncbi:MAG: ABC transporter ATP-binding protein [Chloroflexi bacterium]|nr:ABC transporter ATP-binding protein [Chloroflexota bacterium]MBA3739738.1 ABC transporter ATP-binding protein [Chloroflexota bacterium]